MKKFTALLMVSCWSVATLAQNHDHKHSKKHSHKHSALEAHVHGVASLAIALETNNEVEFKIDMPGDTAVGFEHIPKTDTEKKKVEDTKALLKTKFLEAVVPPSAAKCLLKNSDVEVEYDKKGHAKWEIQASVKCESSIAGSIVEIRFAPHFPKLDKLEVAIIGSDFQKQEILSKGTGSVSLKK